MLLELLGLRNVNAGAWIGRLQKQWIGTGSALHRRLNTKHTHAHTKHQRLGEVGATWFVLSV